MSKKYDFLLVGGGLFNAVFALEAARTKKRCLVVEKRSNLGGNLYCESIEGINVHKYGPHIFHTQNEYIWKYMNCLCDFNNFIYSPLANYNDNLYNLPFNMNTFYQLWGIKTPLEAKRRIAEQQLASSLDESNLENYALSLVGKDIYETLIKGYTEKQWGRSAKELPAFIIKRIPLRFTFNNNYFNDPYQGIPKGGYNIIFERCFKECDVLLNTDFLQNKSLSNLSNAVIYTGMIDEYYNYVYGALEYRSLRFETTVLDMEDFQGIATVNYTHINIPYTRIIEHKHFEPKGQMKTVITKEYPQSWNSTKEPFYPINTIDNQKRYEKYRQLANRESNLFFCGRLGSYTYYNMDQIVMQALEFAKKVL